MEINVKKIVMFEGGVETLAYFSKQMAEQFVKMGYVVFFYNLKDEKGSAKRLRKFIKPGETVMITFNFQGLEKEDGVYSEKSGYVWDEYKIPCYNIAADHPYYYDNRLHDLPKLAVWLFDLCLDAFYGILDAWRYGGKRDNVFLWVVRIPSVFCYHVIDSHVFYGVNQCNYIE